MTKIAVFVGSLQKASYNMKLAKAMEKEAPEGVEFEYINLNLPLFNQDLEAQYPVEAQKMKDIVEGADGVLFVTPEYNRGIPGVLKNAIDWASRPWGTNSFKGKPAGVVGASPTPVGTAIAQSDLRHILAFLQTTQMGQPEVYMANAHQFFDESGDLTDEHWRENIAKYMHEFTEWIKKKS